MIKSIERMTGINAETFMASIPGSKSFTNRALVLAAQRMGRTRITRALHADDTDRLAECLGAFGGLSVTKTADGYVVERTAQRLTAPSEPLYIAGAGTPARFLLAFASAAEGDTVVTGNARLSERPMGDLLRSFDAMGVGYACLKNPDLLPIRVTGSTRSSDPWRISGGISSQFTSALLLLAAQTGPAGQRNEVVVEGHLVSRPYVEMTVQMLREHGIVVECPTPDRFVVESGQAQSDAIAIEPDASGMSYLLGAAAVTGSSVTIPGIGRASAQGDVGFAHLLERMGCHVSFDEAGLHLSAPNRLVGIDCDMEVMPDTVLTLAVIAAFAEGPTRITNIANLRVKECDRIHAAAAELGRAGVSVEEGPDYLVIRPGDDIRPARIETYDDHRVAMAFSLLGLVRDGIVIEDPDCVRKSFPGFWDELARFQSHHRRRAA